ncbi:MAG: hypothetical protein HOD92_10770 [Deltaproteobacteria bacterium]|jgi:hypothetical protein|nr:hypothetical protein [Deltaproteobacteria bacterium]MBT4525374.1 hypothetical protein [Deltaproteobacteria bacterium]
MIYIKKTISSFLIFFYWLMPVFADNQFEFEDSLETIKSKYKGQCVFTKEYEDSQWLWIKKLECKNYKYKRVNTKLVFEFSADKLVRVHIVSIDINNFFLIRNRNNLLVSKTGLQFPNKIKGYSKPLLEDRIHHYENNKTLTYFYYNSNWEWNLVFEDPDYMKEEQQKQKEQVESYQGKGLKGWANFNFNDSVNKVKENLEGLCTTLGIDNKKYLSGKKIMTCKQFPFAKKKIDLTLIFKDSKFVEAELNLNASDYDILLPLLKKKYGKPFQEAINTIDHFPFIYFTKLNILMTFQSKTEQDSEKQLILRYSKEGYFDDSKPIPVLQPKIKKKSSIPPKKKEVKEKDVIYDYL